MSGVNNLSTIVRGLSSGQARAAMRRVLPISSITSNPQLPVTQASQGAVVCSPASGVSFAAEALARYQTRQENRNRQEETPSRSILHRYYQAINQDNENQHGLPVSQAPSSQETVLTLDSGVTRAVLAEISPDINIRSRRAHWSDCLDDIIILDDEGDNSNQLQLTDYEIGLLNSDGGSVSEDIVVLDDGASLEDSSSTDDGADNSPPSSSPPPPLAPPPPPPLPSAEDLAAGYQRGSYQSSDSTDSKQSTEGAFKPKKLTPPKLDYLNTLRAHPKFQAAEKENGSQDDTKPSPLSPALQKFYAEQKGQPVKPTSSNPLHPSKPDMMDFAREIRQKAASVLGSRKPEYVAENDPQPSTSGQSNPAPVSQPVRPRPVPVDSRRPVGLVGALESAFRARQQRLEAAEKAKADAAANQEKGKKDDE